MIKKLGRGSFEEVLIPCLSMIERISSGVVGSKEDSSKEVEEGGEGEEVDGEEEEVDGEEEVEGRDREGGEEQGEEREEDRDVEEEEEEEERDGEEEEERAEGGGEEEQVRIKVEEVGGRADLMSEIFFKKALLKSFANSRLLV